jgi:hypothetical protein
MEDSGSAASPIRTPFAFSSDAAAAGSAGSEVADSSLLRLLVPIPTLFSWEGLLLLR